MSLNDPANNIKVMPSHYLERSTVERRENNHLNEPRQEKTCLCHMRTYSRGLISAFVFAAELVYYLYLL